MNKKLLILTLIIQFSSLAQTFPLVPIKVSGSIENRINIVVLGDGYTLEEQDKFISDTEAFTKSYFDQRPFDNYEHYFNVYAIEVPSNESGANHPGTSLNEPLISEHPIKIVDNYFGSSFDGFGVHRLLYPFKTDAIYTVLISNFPAYDMVVILVNSSFYGGSGGDFATGSTELFGSEVIIHEIGHSFWMLSDEYYPGDSQAKESINMTMESDPTKVKWKNWVNDKEIGVYKHNGADNASNWHKPSSFTCKMEWIEFGFCHVCTEGIIEKIHEEVNPVIEINPQTGGNMSITEETKFGVSLIQSSPALELSWTLNGNHIIDSVNDTISLTPNDLISGENKLQVSIHDSNELIRVDQHQNIHIHTVTWTIDQSNLLVNNIVNEEFKILIYPNPATRSIRFELQGSIESLKKIQLFNSIGQEIPSIQTNKYFDATELSLDNLQPGIYITKLTLSNGSVFTKSIIKK